MDKPKTPLPYPIRISDQRRAEYQAAADASGRTLAGWIKWTCDLEVRRLSDYEREQRRR